MRRGTHLSMMSVFLIVLIVVWILLFAVTATLSWLRGRGADPSGADSPSQSIAGLRLEKTSDDGLEQLL